MHAAPSTVRLRGDRPAPPPGSGDAAPQPVDEVDAPDAERWLRCRECDHALAREDAGFALPGHGPVATFVNPGGFVHEVRTLRDAPGALHAGRRVRADSWFPGYTWRYGLCGGCTAFIGWYYEAAGPVAPDRFWGLRAAAIREA
jgi:cereblon